MAMGIDFSWQLETCQSPDTQRGISISKLETRYPKIAIKRWELINFIQMQVRSQEDTMLS
jgi:hypothetical protein